MRQQLDHINLKHSYPSKCSGSLPEDLE